MNPSEKTRRRKLIWSRIFGVGIAAAIVAMLAFYFFGIIDVWMMIINVLLFSGMEFMVNAGVVQVQGTSKISTINAWLSAILFLTCAGFLIYGLITKNLVLF